LFWLFMWMGAPAQDALYYSIFLEIAINLSWDILIKMESISNAQNNDTIGREPKWETSNMDIGEEEAIRKVEAANTPDHAAQSGVRNVEAVTLTWTKTSLACAFVW
jgi:hypothetical protein